MNEISEMSLGGRTLARLAMGDAVVYEGKSNNDRLKYAYYFNGVDSLCFFKRLNFNMAQGASVFGIDFVTLKDDECFCNGGGVWFLSISNTIRLRATTSAEIIRMGNPGMRVRVVVECDDADNYAMTVNDGEPTRVVSSLRARVNGIGMANIGHIYTWGGIVYGVNIGDGWIPLEQLPEVGFTNVVRYELDKDGYIIKSTATILNT